MASNAKKKLCWNCEGRVTLIEEYCPFCGVYLSPSLVPDGKNPNHHIAPPYRTVETEEILTNQESESISAESVDQIERHLENKDEQVAEEEIKTVLITLASLLAGSVFLIFSVVLYLFSRGSSFILEWNSSYWTVYLAISLPLLFLGWYNLKKIKEPDV